MTDRSAIITTSWDDGHVMDLKLCELLNKYSLRGTLYIAPENREWPKESILKDDQIVELSKNFEIGAHTITHPELTTIPLEEAREEIRNSKEYFDQLLDQETKMFCYPRGLFNTELKNEVKLAGFKGARTIQAFRTSYPEDLFEIGTTHHTVNRPLAKGLMLSLINQTLFVPYVFNSDWVTFAKKSFDIARRAKGVWHFWGHSWQIEQEGWWSQLEEVFQYISNHSDCSYLTNGEMIEA